MEAKTIIKDYAETYRLSLFEFVKNTKVKGEKTLKKLVESKSNELQEKMDKEPTNEKNIILFYILRLSLYFIDGNEFIKENYFCLNDKKIYKAFYELLMNPTAKQGVKFFDSFKNLDYGADIIYLICDFLNKDLHFWIIKVFFSIVLEKHYSSLKRLFDFPINPDRNELLIKLSGFFKIKYNIKEVKRPEIIELFAEKEKDKAIIVNDKNVKKMNKEEGEEQKTNTVKNDSSSIEINKEKEYKNKEKKNKLFINNLNLDIKPKENIENCSSTIKNNRFEKFLCFLKEKEKFYGELKYDPPVLKYLISKNGEIDINYLKYQKERNNFIDHLYDNMENFILKLSLNSIDFLNDRYGYYCN